VFQPNVRFFVAHLGDQAAGCGAGRLFDGYAESKRMYTREAAAARVGKAPLARSRRKRVTPASRCCGLRPGHYRQSDRPYERCGFRACGPFGHYAELPPHRIATSLFYEKPLYPHPNPLPERVAGNVGQALPRDRVRAD